MQYVDRDRNRDRIRARFNANFRVNDTITGRIGIATGGPDPRSSNQTLTDQNSAQGLRSRRGLRHLGAERERGRSPPASSRMPGRAPAACSTTTTSIRKASRSTTPPAISSRRVLRLAGRACAVLQQRDHRHQHGLDHVRRRSSGYRIPFSDSMRLTLAGTYMDFDGVQGYNPFFGGSSFGNTTVRVSANGCSRYAGGRSPPAWPPTSTSSKRRPT